MRPFRFGLVCDANEPGPVATARRAAGAGYQTVLFPDHIESLAPMPAMVAAAAAADSIRVGTQVLNVAFRPLGLLAQEAATVDVVTGGRLELGIGAGYAEDEVRAVGLPFESNGRRIAEVERALRVLPRLFAGETVTEPDPRRPKVQAPEVYQLETPREPLRGYRLDPVPSRVPLMVGGNGDRILAVAAQGADIVQFTGFTAPPGSSFAQFTMDGLADRVDHVRRAAGNRFAGIELSLLVQRAIVTGDPRRVAEDLAVVRSGGLTVEQVLDSPFVLIGTVDAICDRVVELRDRFGVSYLTVFDGRSPGFDAVVGRLAGVG
jgi:probable F420-dependent oxidoreductase